MKKIILICGLMLLLCGCGRFNIKDATNKFKDDIVNSKSYKLSGTMEIMNDEESFIYNLESYYLKDDNYKVILINQTNNHEQIILKTNEEVYVITPELNKSFKFQSEWPDNSSQAYLLNSIMKDLTDDKNAELIDNDSKYVIKSKVNYPNNEELIYQKVYFTKGMKIEKVEVYDKNNIIKIKVSFNKIDMKANLSKKDFNIEEYIDSTKEDVCNDENCKTQKKQEVNQNNKAPQADEKTPSKPESKTPEENNNVKADEKQTKTTGFNLDSVIYPLYIPSETYLSNSETIKTDDGNRVILTFTGEKNFVIIEELSIAEQTMKVVPVYGDPLMLTNSIGALSANSLTWDSDKVTYYLASTDLSTNEMLSIANSLGNSTLVSKEK